MYKQYTKLGERRVRLKTSQRRNTSCHRRELPDFRVPGTSSSVQPEAAVGTQTKTPHRTGPCEPRARGHSSPGRVFIPDTDAKKQPLDHSRAFNSVVIKESGRQDLISEPLEGPPQPRPECLNSVACSASTVESLADSASEASDSQPAAHKTAETAELGAQLDTSEPDTQSTDGMQDNRDAENTWSFQGNGRGQSPLPFPVCRQEAPGSLNFNFRSFSTARQNRCQPDGPAESETDGFHSRSIGPCQTSEPTSSRETTSEASGVSWMDFPGRGDGVQGSSYAQGGRKLVSCRAVASAGGTKGKVNLSYPGRPATASCSMDLERPICTEKLAEQDGRNKQQPHARDSKAERTSIRNRAGRWLRKISSKSGTTDLADSGESGLSGDFPANRKLNYASPRESLALFRKDVVHSVKKTLQHGSGRITGRTCFHGSAGQGVRSAPANNSAAGFPAKSRSGGQILDTRERRTNGGGAVVINTPSWRTLLLGNGVASSRRRTSGSSFYSRARQETMTERSPALSDESSFGDAASSAEDFLEVAVSDSDTSSREELSLLPLRERGRLQSAGFTSTKPAPVGRGLAPAVSKPSPDQDMRGSKNFCVPGYENSDRHMFCSPRRGLSAQSASTSFVRGTTADPLFIKPRRRDGRSVKPGDTRGGRAGVAEETKLPPPLAAERTRSPRISPPFITLAHVNASIDFIVEVGMDPHMTRKARDRHRTCHHEAGSSLSRPCRFPHYPGFLNETTGDASPVRARQAELPSPICQPATTTLQRVNAAELSERQSSTDNTARLRTHAPTKRKMNVDFPLLDDSCENMITIQLAHYDALDTEGEHQRPDGVTYVERPKAPTTGALTRFSYASTEYRVDLDSVI